MISAIDDVRSALPVVRACAALKVPPATYYRSKASATPPVSRRQHRALSGRERQDVLDVLHEPRFIDLAPAQVHAMLLDEHRYLCSERTMYRILAANREVRERRDQLRHPSYTKPHLVATRPNELWSWDIVRHEAP